MNFFERQYVKARHALACLFSRANRLPHHEPVTVLDSTPTLDGEHIDWGLQELHIPEIWHFTKGAGIKIAIIDTGADLTHPDLKDAIVASIDFTGKGTAQDGDGHGTHVAGIIGARAQGSGVVGVAPECQLYIAKALGDDGSGNFSAIVAAVHWCVAQKVDIINLSLGAQVGDLALHTAIQLATANGIAVFCAAGNDGANGKDEVDYPGRYDEVVAVGAIDAYLHLAKFSSVGPQVDILAPGTQVYSTYKGGGYAMLSGTSMATPFVTGVAALALAKSRADGKPLVGCWELRDFLVKHTMARPDLISGNKGFGVISPDAIVNLL